MDYAYQALLVFSASEAPLLYQGDEIGGTKMKTIHEFIRRKQAKLDQNVLLSALDAKTLNIESVAQYFYFWVFTFQDLLEQNEMRIGDPMLRAIASEHKVGIQDTRSGTFRTWKSSGSLNLERTSFSATHMPLPASSRSSSLRSSIHIGSRSNRVSLCPGGRGTCLLPPHGESAQLAQ
ncbi:hypothetical protein [Candidatus Thiosymbion oneisti]|uniref:hypothetical protein n=1 Tax=Candidatus Thiosymbion oneisti TaxID=589554 RepID=UPI00105C2573|nr:hypothetical protein [Candidatus Thiosymbion oneisti]